ncbi:MAG: GGDEF domain-containing protein [Actinobacteria bacterium]|nr:GGDEF domain-containing protein [Actinomycetota bacterium]
MFDYVTRIDPALSTFGWKIVGLAHLAMILPVLGAFLPRDAPTNWPWVGAVCVVVVSIALANVGWFRRMVRSDGYVSPPAWIVLCELLVATVAAAAMCYAIGGVTGIYRPVVFVPMLLVAMMGNRWMILVTWFTAVVAVSVAAVASGSVDEGAVSLVFTYGVVWGIAAIMVHLLAMSALQSDDQMAGLVDAAGIAAQANTLEEGVERLLPLVADWAGAARAAAYHAEADAVTAALSGRVELIGRQPETAQLEAPTSDEFVEAHANRGVILHADRAMLVAESGDGEVLAIVLEGLGQPSYDRLMVQFNLERMVMQIGVLLSRSRYVTRLETLGWTDGLTGIPNRRALNDRLGQELAMASRRGETVSVATIDLDNFKVFNDSFGHLAGDDLLRAYADRLRARLRTSDFVARYGGEEFCVILPATDGPGAEGLFADLHDSFRDADDLHGVTFSAGIAVWDGIEDGDAVVGRADEALYDAKAAGRDRTIVDRAAPVALDPDPRPS